MVGLTMQGSKATSLLEGLQEIYKKKILPVESNFKFDSFHSPLLSENDINAKPMVLLLGQYSTGKTTFIQTLLGREYPGGRIGPEPTTDRFVAVMHGSQEKVIPGNAAAIQADKPFTGLARFGSSFLSKFQVSELPSQLLESITIVDTPGVLSGDKQRLGRAYDYPQVSRWFAEHADLILIFFDAHKLDISDELKDVLEILEPHEDKIRIVLNKADQVGRQELMRVYGALMWSLGKVIQTPEVPRVYISSFRTESQVAVENILMEEEKRDLIHELKQLPSNSATRRVNDLVKRARVAKVHAIIINYLRNQMPAMFGKSSKQTKLVDNLAQEFTKIQQEYRIPKGDFPDLEDYTAKLREIDLCNFPKLGSSKLVAIDEAIALDIPRLLQRYPPMFDQISIIETANPFVDSRNAVRMADKELLNRDRIDMVKSTKIFETLHPVNGKLSGRVCRQFFLQSGLSSETMAKLWALSDQDLDGYLDLNEFALMTYLVQLKLAGIEIPDTLPDRVTVESEHFN
jgi:GTPase SAR1 family protein